MVYDPYYVLSSRILLLFAVGIGGRRRRMIFGCYSKLLTELAVLAFLGSVFSKSLTHTIPAFLTFW